MQNQRVKLYALQSLCVYQNCKNLYKDIYTRKLQGET